jgi:hypothetical protein
MRSHHDRGISVRRLVRPLAFGTAVALGCTAERALAPSEPDGPNLLRVTVADTSFFDGLFGTPVNGLADRVQIDPPNFEILCNAVDACGPMPGAEPPDTGPGDSTPPPPPPPPPPPGAATPWPIGDMGDSLTYKGFEGGLYPGGSNEIPILHASLHPVVPPPDGEPWALVSIGMSNTFDHFCRGGRQPDGSMHEGDVGPQNCVDFTVVGQAGWDRGDLRLVNCAQGGQPAQAWTSADARPFDECDIELGRFDLDPDRVRAAWVLQTMATPVQERRALPDPAAEAYALEAALADFARAARLRYPNLQAVYFSSRIWSCGTGGISPEPYAYESGYAVKWLIEAQLVQEATGIIDGRAGDLGDAPWLGWGPYLWANGSTPRLDGLFWTPEDLWTDCIHPIEAGIRKAAPRIIAFFETSPLTASWFTP